MVIQQGDVFRLALTRPTGEKGYTRPYVVIQSDEFNQTLINSVVVCALT